MENKLEKITTLYVILTIIFNIVLLFVGIIPIKIVSGLLLCLFGYLTYLGAKYYLIQKNKEKDETI